MNCWKDGSLARSELYPTGFPLRSFKESTAMAEIAECCYIRWQEVCAHPQRLPTTCNDKHSRSPITFLDTHIHISTDGSMNEKTNRQKIKPMMND
eukprot:scaffold54212_cov17-Prasinocladus_malaysianus.AAC.1